jgi:hypothetical protein
VVSASGKVRCGAGARRYANRFALTVTYILAISSHTGIFSPRSAPRDEEERHRAVPRSPAVPPLL